MSERGSSGWPVTCSGDMYLGEPSAVPVCVIEEEATCATPKSVSFARQSADTMMFAGLMSRCVIPKRCARSRPSATCATRSAMRGDRQPRRLAQDLLQRLALEQLHRDVGDAVLLADVVDGDDVGMVEAAGRARLAQEALAHLAHDLRGQVRQQRLDRDVALDERIDGAVHRAHGAAAELGDDDVAPELRLFAKRFPRR